MKTSKGIPVSSLPPHILALNPHLGIKQTISVPVSEKPKANGLRAPRTRKSMNKTEREFSMLLTSWVSQKKLIEWVHEGVTLRWADGMTYTPDFWTAAPSGLHILYECKGPYIEEDALIKFRAARDKWGEYFEFRFWQKRDGWRELEFSSQYYND